jgi:very-short-patch-repair endonuclease
LAEVLLWQRLSKRQVRGRDFHRQRAVDEYILDFFSPELMLAIEIDGCSHALKGAADENRQRRLEGLGIRLLRFKESEVRRNLDGVVQAIEQWIAAWRPSHTPACGHLSQEGISGFRLMTRAPIK